ncbi:hypothetical protein TNCV_3925771 [Trichonephila clavipes]|nr:hypothetical protein TNCV_3925771 [Trichonephila clavipes]
MGDCKEASMCVCFKVLLDQTTFLWMTMHGHNGLLTFSSYLKMKLSLEGNIQHLNLTEHVWDAFGRPFCGTTTSSGEHLTTETDADLGMDALNPRTVVQYVAEYRETM